MTLFWCCLIFRPSNFYTVFFCQSTTTTIALTMSLARILTISFCLFWFHGMSLSIWHIKILKLCKKRISVWHLIDFYWPHQAKINKRVISFTCSAPLSPLQFIEFSKICLPFDTVFSTFLLILHVLYFRPCLLLLIWIIANCIVNASERTLYQKTDQRKTDLNKSAAKKHTHSTHAVYYSEQSTVHGTICVYWHNRSGNEGQGKEEEKSTLLEYQIIYVIVA